MSDSQSLPNDPLGTLPGYLLRRAANAMMAELANRLGTMSVRISDASVLLLIDARTGRVLYEKDADTAIPPASMSKLMTMIMVFEALKAVFGAVCTSGRRHLWRIMVHGTTSSSA